jgi:hypothetical protein
MTPRPKVCGDGIPYLTEKQRRVVEAMVRRREKVLKRGLPVEQTGIVLPSPLFDAKGLFSVSGATMLALESKRVIEWRGLQVGYVLTDAYLREAALEAERTEHG